MPGVVSGGPDSGSADYALWRVATAHPAAPLTGSAPTCLDPPSSGASVLAQSCQAGTAGPNDWTDPCQARRAGPRRAGPRRAGPRRAGPRRAGPRRAGPRRAGQGRIGPRDLCSGHRLHCHLDRYQPSAGLDQGSTQRLSRPRPGTGHTASPDTAFWDRRMGLPGAIAHGQVSASASRYASRSRASEAPLCASCDQTSSATRRPAHRSSGATAGAPGP
jgi:hypothetical protein